MNIILWNGKTRVENLKNCHVEFEKTRAYAQKPRLKIPSKNSISERYGRNFGQANRFVQKAATQYPKSELF
jgi:hypothetical protein